MNMKSDNVVFLKINQMLVDVSIFIIGCFLAFFIRFEGVPDPENLKQLATIKKRDAVIKETPARLATSARVTLISESNPNEC